MTNNKKNEYMSRKQHIDTYIKGSGEELLAAQRNVESRPHSRLYRLEAKEYMVISTGSVINRVPGKTLIG